MSDQIRIICALEAVAAHIDRLRALYVVRKVSQQKARKEAGKVLVYVEVELLPAADHDLLAVETAITLAEESES